MKKAKRKEGGSRNNSSSYNHHSNRRREGNNAISLANIKKKTIFSAQKRLHSRQKNYLDSMGYYRKYPKSMTIILSEGIAMLTRSTD